MWPTVVPHPPVYEADAGRSYADLLSRRMQLLSFWLTGMGWLLVVAATLLATAGSLQGTSETDSDLCLFARYPGLSYTLMAIVCAGLGWQVLDRAASATRTASIATLALWKAVAHSDQQAYQACIEAKSSWLEGRLSVDRLERISSALGLRPDLPGASQTTPPKAQSTGEQTGK